jgi:hypothetical protein
VRSSVCLYVGPELSRCVQLVILSGARPWSVFVWG